eukprot:c34249_g1_i1.p2 GENE.c34249_g1_i1~~c34249_g1_i1.p2  ORF type:complete len:211 (-),score=55.51 c34249_g1_i1:3-635(-)
MAASSPLGGSAPGTPGAVGEIAHEGDFGAEHGTPGGKAAARKKPKAKALPALDSMMERELADAFDFLCGVNETIGPAELKVALQALGQKPTNEELKMMIAGHSKQGGIKREQFVQIMHERMWAEDDDDELARCYRVFASDAAAGIGMDDLREVSFLLGSEATEDALGELLEEALGGAAASGDRSNSWRDGGRVTQAQFMAAVKEGRATIR